MRNSTVTEALIYESQGLKDDALKVYRNILKNDPENKEAIGAIRRISGLRKRRSDVNAKMLDFFINMKTKNEIDEFKLWLTKI